MVLTYNCATPWRNFKLARRAGTLPACNPLLLNKKSRGCRTGLPIVAITYIRWTNDALGWFVGTSLVCLARPQFRRNMYPTYVGTWLMNPTGNIARILQKKRSSPLTIRRRRDYSMSSEYLGGWTLAACLISASCCSLRT